uniref:Epl1 protein (Extracellular small protein 1) n=1 Tax=Ganoderma boninense TaxID=34458 RepID=A0A5K1JUY8_9APHY|nr:Epl1 protein (Extracellular small protein 1) [Ganoderma boninense]
MAPLSHLTLNYLSVVIQHPGLPASRPSWTQYSYFPLVAIAAVILVLIASCGDGDAPIGPRRRDASHDNDSWSEDGASLTELDVEAGHDRDALHPMEAAVGGTLGPVPPSMPPPPPSPTSTAPPPYSRRAPFPY